MGEKIPEMGRFKPVADYLENILESAEAILSEPPIGEDPETEEDVAQIQIALADLADGITGPAIAFLKKVRAEIVGEGAPESSARIPKIDQMLAILEFEPN